MSRLDRALRWAILPLVLLAGLTYVAPRLHSQSANTIFLSSSAGAVPWSGSTSGVPTVTLGTISSPFLPADGTSGAPQYSFASEPTLGFWRSSAGTIRAQGALTVTATLNATSSVGVGAGVTYLSSTTASNLIIQNTGATIGVNLKVDALPTAGTCGTSPAVTAGSTPLAGSINVGTGGTATACGVTFGGTAYPSAPFCVANGSTATPANVRALAVSTTTTTLTVTAASAWVASEVVQWVCISSK